MKRKTILFGLMISLGALGACSKSDEQVIIAACENSDANASAAFCTCSYEQMEATLPPDTLAAIAEQIRDGSRTPQEAIGELPQVMQLQTLPVLPKLLNCIDEE